MRTTDKRKITVSIPADYVDEIREEAKRLDRPISWITQRAWKVYKARVERDLNKEKEGQS